jgi:hypothetical protein
MKRRHLLQCAVASSTLPFVDVPASTRAATPRAVSRVRPGDPQWPSLSEWESLRQSVGGNLVRLHSPLDVCHAEPDGETCRDLVRELKNPYFIDLM